MPLLRKKEFQKTSVPELLRDDEEVFHCEITNEVFRDYDEFCQRIILVNSMVWSCAMTGKSNLTYAEALQSEKTARKSLKDFPMELRLPVLYLASKTKRSAFGDMAEDIFSYIKDRYFVGEIVESCFTENNWKESHVLQVIAPNAEQIDNYNKNQNKSPEKTSFSPPASLYRYEVEQLDANDQDSSHVMILEANHVRRKKGPFSKEKTRLFLKQFVELNDQGVIIIKETVKRKYKLDLVRFDQIFDGPLPEFEQTKRTPKSINGKFKDKKVRQESISKFLDKGNNVNAKNRTSNGKNLMEEMKRKEIEYKQKLEEMKRKRIEEKILEKQKRKEESIKIATYVKDWYKPRDDLLLEDQKVLPTPTPVQTKIPTKYFGDTLMILEFVNSFSSILSTKDFFPGGLNLDLLERALLEKEVAGPLTDIIQLLLTALFNVQNEEAAENKHSETELNSDEMNEGMSLSEAARLATSASKWSIIYQGQPLSRLPLCPVTMSEILRLHLLGSGALLSEAASKWRFQQRGGYMSEDDPGLALRIKHPHILKALAVHNVNQFSIGDKVKILSCLIDQLLTYADVRDVIEERLDKTRQLKNELKALQTAEKKIEQEAISARFKFKKEYKNMPDVFQKEMDKLTIDNDKKKAEFEYRIKELMKVLAEHQPNHYGCDRAFRRYIKVDTIPAFFVENDEKHPGLCYDKIIAQKPELIGMSQEDTLTYLKKLCEENYGSDKENQNNGKKNAKKINGVRNSLKLDDLKSTRDLLLCTANNHPCPVHSNENKPSWSFYHNKSDFENLLTSLNKRGVRENELKQALEFDKIQLEKIINDTNPSRLNITIKTEDEKQIAPKKIPKALKYEDASLGYPPETEFSEILNLALIDNILELEEKIFAGNLGQLKVKNRDAWRNNLNNKNFIDLDKTLIKKEDPQLEKIKIEGRNSSSRPSTPDSLYKDPGKYLGTTLEVNGHDSDIDNDIMELKPTNDQANAIKTLAIALLQVAQAVESKYLMKPLGHADASAKKKEEIDILDRWEQSLMAATSYSQVFLHYCTLDNCIMWSRSVLKARCQVCRRQRDPENMLLCDNCNKGFHLYCLKPQLTSVPRGDWYCIKCKPEVPSPRIARRERKIFREDSEEEDESEEDKDNEDDDSSYENEKSTTNISMMEVCEGCGLGGHVICCDSCPKVYHLECTQPALRRVPRGEWKCHKCKNKKSHEKRHSEKNDYSVDPPYVNGRGDYEMDDDYEEQRGPYIRRRCATKARSKIHGFVRTLRRTSVDSNSGEEAPQRRSMRRGYDSKGAAEDDLPLHNAALQELLADVMKHKDAWPFTRPVTKQEVPDYFDVITKPMDFGTIKYKLNMGEYHHDAQVMMDCALVFENCDTYNHAEADVYKCGIRLLKFFEKRSNELGFKLPSKVMGGAESDDDGPSAPKKSRH